MEHKLPKPLRTKSGCKVGWMFFATREEAEAWLPAVEKTASAKAARGYDFGYSRPGVITEIEHSGEFRLTTAL